MLGNHNHSISLNFLLKYKKSPELLGSRAGSYVIYPTSRALVLNLVIYVHDGASLLIAS